MGNSRFIIKLEESLDNSKEISFEDAMRILKRKNVNKEFTKIFDGKDKISEEEIDELSTSSVVKGLLFLFARLNNIEILVENSISISDLDYSLYSYYKTISSINHLSKEREEELLRNTSQENKQIVIESRIEYVFDEALRYVTDSEMFTELLSEGNNALVDSVESYDPKKHESFDMYLSYNINNALSNKLDEIIGYRNQPIVKVNEATDEDQKRVEDRAYLESLFIESGLSDAEKAVLELEYGLSERSKFSEEYLKTIGSLDIVNTLSLQISAIEKIRQKKTRK